MCCTVSTSTKVLVWVPMTDEYCTCTSTNTFLLNLIDWMEYEYLNSSVVWIHEYLNVD